MSEKNSLQTVEKSLLNAQILSQLLHRLMESQSKLQLKSDFACQPHTPNAISACDGIFHQNEQKSECCQTESTNYKFVRQLEEVEVRARDLIPRINHAKEQLKALEERIARDKINTRYRVTCSDTLSNNIAASVIADAILFDPQAVQLVARSM